MNCQIKTKMQASNYELSADARAGINFKTGQSVSSFQTFECTCGTDDEDFRDVDGNAFETDTNFFEDGKVDWKLSSVFRIHDCKKLRLTLDQTSSTFANRLEGAVLLVENVEDLGLDNLRCSLRGTGTNRDEGTFTSILFRNVMFTRFPTTSSPVIKFEEKAEVLFHKIKVDSGLKFDMEAKNLMNAHDPVFRVEESTFPGATNIETGVTSSDDSFKLDITNDQKVVDTTDSNNEGCERDPKGTVVIKKNTMGLLRLNNIRIFSSKRIEVEDNEVAVGTGNAIVTQNVKELLIRRNTFAFLLSNPVLDLEYRKKLSTACTNDDMPEAAIKVINLSGNEFPAPSSGSTTFVKARLDSGYSDQLVEKFDMVNNSLSAVCDCDKPTVADEANPTDDEKVHMKLIDQSKCVSKNSGMPLVGLRKDICAGKHPQTPEEREDEIKDEMKRKWTTYLIVAILVTALIAAVVAAVIVKFCCNGGNSSDVTPRRA